MTATHKPSPTDRLDALRAEMHELYQRNERNAEILRRIEHLAEEIRKELEEP